MVDINSYRARVGAFSSKHLCYGGYLKLSSYLQTNRIRGGCMLGFPVVFLCMVGLSSICTINDPSIELNPGPSQSKQLLYKSNEGARLFKNMRTKNSDIAQISSHRNFLHTCRTINVVIQHRKRPTNTQQWQ